LVLIYCEACGHSELARQIYGEKFLQRILTNARTFVNVVQHLRDFGRFEMNKRDLGRQREDRILVAEEEILHEIENQPRTSTPRLANHLGVSHFVVWLRVHQNSAREMRQNRVRFFGYVVLKLAFQTMAGILSNIFEVSFYDAFTHNYSLFTLLFKPLLFLSSLYKKIRLQKNS
jgi:hypothetical protein